MKRKISIWDIIALLALLSIVVWVTLKIVGVIKTPLWLEYAPVYSASYVAGWLMHKVYSVSADVKDLKKFKDATIDEINKMKINCAKNHD